MVLAIQLQVNVFVNNSGLAYNATKKYAHQMVDYHLMFLLQIVLAMMVGLVNSVTFKLVKKIVQIKEFVKELPVNVLMDLKELIVNR